MDKYHIVVRIYMACGGNGMKWKTK